MLDDEGPLSSLLQKCLVLGGDAGSKKMRNWARQELNGYHGPTEEVPTYRHVPAALMAVITNQAGYDGITRRIPDSAFPSQVRDIIRETVDLEDAILTESIGELEAMASQHTLATLHAADSQFRWWWPTNWMAVPSVIFVAGCLLVAVPVRRSPAQGAVGAASLTRPAVSLPGDDRAGVAVRPGQVVVGEIPREPAAFVARVMVSRLAAAAGGGGWRWCAR